MKYEKVPEILTGKDLDYLEDAFRWNYASYKNTLEAAQMLEDEKLAKLAEKASDLFASKLEEIMEILEGGLNESSK